MSTSLLKGLLESGAPWGILCAVLLAAVVALWKRSVALSDKLYELAVNQVKKDEQVHATLESVRREIEEIRRLS
jgi:hypothetical protein